MGIFGKREIDLSDEALAAAAEQSNEIASGSAAEHSQNDASHEQSDLEQQLNGNQQQTAEAEEEQTEMEQAAASELEQDPWDSEAKAERENLWQQAKAETAELWPQAMGEGEKLISKMIEIGERYGDPQLWQRSPAGIMREAAIELFGLPRQRDNAYARLAAESAREAALKEMSLRNQAKIGLHKNNSRQAPPAPLTEEEKIIESISRAKKSNIFS